MQYLSKHPKEIRSGRNPIKLRTDVAQAKLPGSYKKTSAHYYRIPRLPFL